MVKTHPSGDGEIDLEKPCLISQLALVDLAGAERAIRTGNAGSALKEAGMITFLYSLESKNHHQGNHKISIFNFYELNYFRENQ